MPAEPCHFTAHCGRKARHELRNLRTGAMLLLCDLCAELVQVCAMERFGKPYREVNCALPAGDA